MGRRRIGLLFILDKTWTGGYYYLLNLVRACATLPPARQPHLIFFTNNGSMPDLEDVKYEHISALPIIKKRNRYEWLAIRMGILNSEYISHYSARTVDFIYPFNADYKFASLAKLRLVYWLPDFQHKYLKHFFSSDEIDGREQSFKAISEKRNKLVLSSEAAKEDFVKFYPNHKNEVHVIPFATTLPPFLELPIESVRLKYSIGATYFFSPNQFWAHKNHQVILDALIILTGRGVQCEVVFSGNENDYRNHGYLRRLKDFVAENNLQSMVKFLGFIDRRDQLQLMNHAIAVIQPSLFEGWSTVVEDAKAMNQNLILSDIKVHREQCGENGLYFTPSSACELADRMEQFLKSRLSRPDYNYGMLVAEFAEKLLLLA